MGVQICNRKGRKRNFGIVTEVGSKRTWEYFEKKADRDEELKRRKKRALAEGSAILRLSSVDAGVMLRCLELMGSAQAVLRAVEDAAVRSVSEVVSLRTAMDECIAEKKGLGLSDADYIRHFKRSCDRFPDPSRMAHSITAKDAREWIAGMDVAPVTKKTYAKHGRTLWKWMVKRGYARTNIFEDVPVPQVVEVEPGFLSVEDMAALFRTAQAEFPVAVAYLALGAFAGIRSSAMVRMDVKEHVRFEQKGILITGDVAKNSRRQFVDGHPDNLWLWLNWCRKKAPAGFALGKREWDVLRAQVAKKAGVVMPHNALRHSFCTYHVALSGDAGKTATLLTHRGNVAILYEHYKGNAAKGEAREYFKIRP